MCVVCARACISTFSNVCVVLVCYSDGEFCEIVVDGTAVTTSNEDPTVIGNLNAAESAGVATAFLLALCALCLFLVFLARRSRADKEDKALIDVKGSSSDFAHPSSAEVPMTEMAITATDVSGTGESGLDSTAVPSGTGQFSSVDSTVAAGVPMASANGLGGAWRSVLALHGLYVATS